MSVGNQDNSLSLLGALLNRWRSHPREYLLLLLLGVQAVVMVIMARVYAFPIGGYVAALLAAEVFRNRAIRFSRDRTVVGSVLLAGVFLAKWRLFPHNLDYANMMVNYGLAYACAQYFFVLQVLGFVVRPYPRHSDELSPVLPLFGIITMVCAGNVYVAQSVANSYLVLSAVFTLLCGLYFMVCFPVLRAWDRSKRVVWTGAYTVMFIIVLTAGYATSTAVWNHQQELNVLFARMIQKSPVKPSNLGFSRHAQLNSVSGSGIKSSNEVAVRITSSRMPGYLRGMAYEEYDPPGWNAQGGRHWLKEAANLPDGADVENDLPLFLLRDAGKAPWLEQTIWPAKSVERVLFTTLETAYVGAPITALSADSALIVDAADQTPPPFHVNLVSSSSRSGPITEDERSVLTQLPDDLDPHILDLANALTRDCRSDLERIDAVAAYFIGTYEYRLGVEVPEGQDPLTYFLLEKPPAHCEYFATGTTVLLRACGVPARYVNGFLVTEGSPYGEYWIARDRDAHAWVEAYTPETGWLTVESTPPAGVPGAEKRSKLAYLADALAFRWQEFVAALRDDVVGALKGWFAEMGLLLLRFFGTTWWGAGIVLLVIAALVWRMRHWLRKRRRGVRLVRSPLHKLLDEMDRQTAALGFERAPHETLHQFAGRLRTTEEEAGWGSQAAEWYETYAIIRYRGSSMMGELERLQGLMPQVPSRSAE